MKLYSVRLWDDDLKEERTVLIVSTSEREAETEALDNDYLACAEAEEVIQIDGYKVIFEKVNK